jgi:hypothetical protein
MRSESQVGDRCIRPAPKFNAAEKSSAQQTLVLLPSVT